MSSSKNTSSSSEDDIEIRRGPWTLDEDELLIKHIANHGEGRWNLLAKHSGLKRTGKSCRLRWLNYLKPDVKRGNLSPQEQLIIFELHSKWGNRWSKIAQRLPGRTDNEIKNYWRTRVQKQAKHLKVDSNSIEFQKIIRLLWMPHLLQNVEESFSSSQASDQNQTMPLSSIQYSESATPTQFPLQEHCNPCVYETVLDSDQHDPCSDIEHNTSSYISADSMNTTSKMSGYSNSQLQIMCNSESSTFPDSDHCHKNNDVYSTDTFNLNTTTSAAAGFEFPVGDCQGTESNWIDKDFSEYLQSIDELGKIWQ